MQCQKKAVLLTKTPENPCHERGGLELRQILDEKRLQQLPTLASIA